MFGESPTGMKGNIVVRQRRAFYAVIASFATFLLALLLFPTFLPTSTHAEEDNEDITPSIIIGDGGVLSLALKADQFASASQTITVSTNNYTGYTLTATTTDGSTDLINTTNPYLIIPTISLPYMKDSILPEDFSAPSYGLSINGTDYTPLVNGGVIKQNMTSGTDNIELTLGVRTALDTPAGVYERTFNLTATANETVFSITYDANTTDEVAGMPDSPQITGEVSGSLLKLAPEIPARNGYVFVGWDEDRSSTTATYSAGDDYELNPTSSNDITLYAIWKVITFNITLDNNGATTEGSLSTTVQYNGTTLEEVANPERRYTISGFGLAPSGGNATVSSTKNLTSTYTFNGWYQESSALNKIASNDTTPVLEANTAYTSADGEWTHPDSVILYAGWSPESVPLPRITRTGSTCGWATSENATSWTYRSGASIIPSDDLVLYGVCRNNLILDANGGTGGSSSAFVEYNTNALSRITSPSRDDSIGTYTISGFALTPSGANAVVSSTDDIISSNLTTYAFNGWYEEPSATNKIALNGTNPSLRPNTTYTDASGNWVYTEPVEVTLYAGWEANVGEYDIIALPTITRDGSTCGWATSVSATTWTYNSGATFIPSSDLILYGVCRNNITLDNNGATTEGSTSTTVAYDSNTLAPITNPQRKYTVSGFTTPSGNNASGASVSSSSTITSTYAFNGWYQESGATNKIASNATTPVLEANTVYTDASGRWNYTDTNRVTLYAGWTAKAITLPSITKAGYNCGWTTTATGATTISYNSGASFTPAGNTTLYGVCKPNTYTIAYTLNGGSATTKPTSATYDAEVNISNATKTVKVTGNANNIENVTISDPTSKAQDFAGWSSTTMGANALTGTASGSVATPWNGSATKNTYFKNLRESGTVTMIANWTPVAFNLPTVTKSGYECEWNTQANGSGTSYDSGASYTPSANSDANITLYAQCIAVDFTITVNAGNGINTLASSGWTGTGTGTISRIYRIGDTIDLSSITPAYKTGYKDAKYTKNDSFGSLSGSTYTVGAGDGNITIHAASLNTPVCTIQGGATKVFNRSATTLTATSNADSYDTNSTNITYSFGYASSDSAALGNFSTATTANTFAVAKGAYRGTRYYGVKVVVTNKNDSTITSTCTSGTGSNTGTNVAARTTMVLVNSRIQFDATTNGGTLTGTNPLYVAYGGAYNAFYTGRANSTAGTLPTATPPTGYSFEGWFTTTGTKVINPDGTLTGVAVSGWNDASNKWVKTGTSNSATATANILIARYGANSYTITLNGNGATSSGSTSTTVSYDSTTLSSITNPQRKYTASGFTLTPSGANATVSSTATVTSTYTFNGWYQEAAATNKIASNATTPVLEANTAYTDASGKWISTSDQTLYAGWTSKAITLPTITRTGSTCGWATSSTATAWNYASGASITPTANLTLYGVCRNNITLNGNGATTAGSTSTTVVYNATTLGSITNPKRSYTVKGFTLTSSGANATVSATTTLTSTYTFNGWYKESGATNKIADNAATPALQASTTYTDANKKWTYTAAEAITLYAGWTSKAVTLPTITREGSTCGWATSSTATAWNYASGASVTPTKNLTLYGVCRNNITLNGNGATTAGSTSTTVVYNATTLGKITVPQRKYTVSGFTLTSSGANATVSATTTLTSTYTFNGWYKESAATNKIASNAATPALEASTTYTDANKKWTYTTAGNITLYAGWTSKAVTLPTITREGSTCGWATSSTATTWTYASGASFTPTANTTLYGVCRGNITLNGNGATTAGSTSTTATYGSTTLASITNPQRKYTVKGFTLTPSGANATVSATTTLTSTYTFNGWYKESAATNKIASNATTPALEASTAYTDANKKWNYTGASAVTLYAGWTGKAVTLPTITREGSTCGWATSSSATAWNYTSGASVTPTANLTLYGVCRNNITLNGNGATTAGSTSTTVVYNATTLGSITNPQRKYTVKGFTLTPSGANATVSATTTLTSTYTFNGWYQEAAATNKIASNATTPALEASTAYTDANKKWTYTTAGAITLYAGWTSKAVTLPTITRTGSTCGWATSSTATAWNYASGASVTPTKNLTLYGVCRNNITLNGNGATTAGSTSTTVVYNATTLGNITVPQRKYTVKGFTLATSGANATVSATTTLTSTYTFNGWYKESGATNKIASNATTPALQASTTYTDANSKWTYTTASAVTLYAGWSGQAVTLPTITRTGSTCGWATSSSATSWTYNSGASITPTANLTLYGVCRNDITLNKNGATNTPTASTTATYGATTLGAIATLPQRKYTVKGFTLATSGANATVSATTTLNSTYTFAGWYKESGATNKIADNAATPALQASTTYTDANKKWTYTTASAVTLYAGWTGGSVTLPTITRTGSTCGWATSNTATTWNYASGASISPTKNLTLYGVCRGNITLNKNGATNSPTGSTTAVYGSTTLGAIATLPQRKYTVKGFTLTTSGANATVSSTATITSTYTFTGWYKESGATNKIADNAATPALQASTTYTDANKKWTYTTASAVTLYAGWTSQAITLPTITRTGSTCGWATSSTATTWTYASGASVTPTANLTLYGVCRNNITLNKNGATNSPTGSTTAVYGSTTLGAIATLPQRKYTVNGFTLTPSGANATVSATTTLNSTYTFAGWYKESGATNKIADNAATPALQASTTYTDANKKWTYTTASAVTLYAGWSGGSVTLPTITRAGSTCGWATSNTATAWNYASGASINPTANLTLYGVCRGNITLNKNGATNSPTTSTTATYGATTLGAIATLPQRKYTASGFTLTTSGANATVSSTATVTSTYTFNGWYKESGATNKIASNAATPALEASTTYTDANKKWTYTSASAVTLYAGWTSKAITLPTITRTGSTCGWATSSTATAWNYASGASITPTANLTLYGVCRGNITLNKNGATNNPTTSTTATYGATTLGAIATLPQRKYTASGFSAPAGNNADGATVSATTTLTSTYTFAGWYKQAGATNKIASNAATPALQANTTYTDANKKWTYTSASAVTLYAGWTGGSIVLPTIKKTGYTCGWTTTSTGATIVTYPSGVSLNPTANLTLYGVCTLTQYNITYDKNAGSDTVSNMPTSPQTATMNGTGLTLATKVPTRTNYTFFGWASSSSATTAEYQPGGTYPVTASTPVDITLYAVWVRNMQKWDGCSSLSSGSTIKLADTRDHTIYNVTKFADGKCWMSQNMRLDFRNLSENISTSNTNNPTSVFMTSANNNPAANSHCSGSEACINKVSYQTKFLGKTTDDGSDTGHTLDEYGVHYNWYTATAGNGTYSTGGTTGDDAEEIRVGGDLCPAGWHLPSGGKGDSGILDDTPAEANEYAQLVIALGGSRERDTGTTATAVASTLLGSPYNFVLNGPHWGRDGSRGVIGAYWTSTSSSYYGNVYLFDFSKERTTTYRNRTKPNGVGVRCIVGQQYSVYFEANDGIGYIYPLIYYDNKTSSNHKFTLPSGTSLPTRTGYTFKGWSTDPNATTAAYTAGGTITLQQSSPEITLYAVWQVANNRTMQNLSSWASSVAQGQSTTAIDTRDGQGYTVARLADGKLWMTKNLSLRFKMLKQNISASNTNNPTSAFMTWANSKPDWVAPNEREEPWCTSDDASCINTFIYDAENVGFTKNKVMKEYPSESTWYDEDGSSYEGGSVAFYAEKDTDYLGVKIDNYGAYYNYYTATAGHGSASLTSGKVSGDICPAGWHLPTGNYSNSEYGTLNQKINSGSETTNTGLRPGSSFDMPYSGWREGRTLYNTSWSGDGLIDGWLWAADSYTNSSGTWSYFFGSRQGSATGVTPKVFLGYGNKRYQGFSVRCVAGQLYTVNFNSNKGVNGPTNQSGYDESGSQSITFALTTTKPTRTGYTFKGWATSSTATTATYQAGANITMSYSNPTITLYAVWEATTRTMQGVSSWASSVGSGATTEAIDTRDGQGYTVARINGKLWMTKNLQLNFANLTNSITTSNTNNPTSAFITWANSKPASTSSSWCSDDTQACHNQFQYDSYWAGKSGTDLYGDTVDSYGIYYNYYTASAGHAGYGSSPNPVSGDICPSGWRLPTSSDFTSLNSAINSGSTTSDSGLRSTFKTVYAGFRADSIWNTATGQQRVNDTNLWSGSSFSNNGYWAVTLSSRQGSAVSSPYVNTDWGWRRYNGYNVRCIAK